MVMTVLFYLANNDTEVHYIRIKCKAMCTVDPGINKLCILRLCRVSQTTSQELSSW